MEVLDMSTHKDILEETPLLFSKARGQIMRGVRNLWEIRDKGLWAGSTSSFTEYVEDVCQLDKGQASRWLTSYEHYAIQGGVDFAQLGAVNPDRLYLARNLKGTPKQQMEKALQLSRSELKAQAVYEETGSEHECVPVTFCRICHRRMNA